MTSTRAYRKALPVSDAIAEIRRCSGTQLDPDIVLAFPPANRRSSCPGTRASRRDSRSRFLLCSGRRSTELSPFRRREGGSGLTSRR